MIPKATNEPAPIGTSRMRGEPANPSSTSKNPSATSAEGKGSSAPEMGVAASCVARSSGALIAGAARMEPLLSGTCLCAGAAWNADAESTAHSISKDLIVDERARAVRWRGVKDTDRKFKQTRVQKQSVLTPRDGR